MFRKFISSYHINLNSLNTHNKKSQYLEQKKISKLRTEIWFARQMEKKITFLSVVYSKPQNINLREFIMM